MVHPDPVLTETTDISAPSKRSRPVADELDAHGDHPRPNVLPYGMRQAPSARICQGFGVLRTGSVSTTSVLAGTPLQRTQWSPNRRTSIVNAFGDQSWYANGPGIVLMNEGIGAPSSFSRNDVGASSKGLVSGRQGGFDRWLRIRA